MMNEELPQARVYCTGPAGQWFYQIGDEPPRGPYPGQIPAGKAARKEIVARADAKDAIQ